MIKLSSLTPVLAKKYRRMKILLILLGGVSVLLPLIANDKPLFLLYNNALYFPIFKDYPETVFGGEFDLKTNYRDPYVQALIQKKGWMVWPLIPFSYDTIHYETKHVLPAPPNAINWLGTDEYGRDLLARLLYSLRLSLVYGLTVAVLSIFVALALGIMQGYFGGWVDLLLQRFTEVWSGIPILFVLMVLTAYYDLNFFSLVVVMIAFKWLMLVQIIRAEVLRIKRSNYVQSAKLIGFSESYIMYRYILPNVLHTVYAMFPFVVISAISALTTLDFLGLGLPPSAPSLGEILNEAKNNLHAPWIGLTAFCVMAGLLLFFVYLGELFKDIFHPYQSPEIDQW